jgi:hypothetical protein
MGTVPVYYKQLYILQKVGLINQAPTINNKQKMGPGPILFILLTESICMALTLA